MTERIFPTDAHGNPLGPSREEVVRCRDCARCQKYTCYERTWPEITEYEAHWCNQFNENVNIDGYCVWGARADE